MSDLNLIFPLVIRSLSLSLCFHACCDNKPTIWVNGSWEIGSNKYEMIEGKRCLRWSLSGCCHCNAGAPGLELAPGSGYFKRTTRRTRGVRNVFITHKVGKLQQLPVEMQEWSFWLRASGVFYAHKQRERLSHWGTSRPLQWMGARCAACLQELITSMRTAENILSRHCWKLFVRWLLAWQLSVFWVLGGAVPELTLQSPKNPEHVYR